MRKQRIVRRTSYLLAACVFCVGLDRPLADVPARKARVHLAFVLLTQPGLPKGEDVVRAFASIAPKEQSLRLRSTPTRKTLEKEILEFEVSPGGTAFIAAMPAPVPKGEADDAVRFSVSSMGTGWKLPAYKAHLVVTSPSTDSSSEIATLSSFTSLVAAVAKASSAVGIYWGNGGATHSAEFFVAVASKPGLVPRIMLWTGVSLAREPDGRLNLLSLGMKQLDLPDLLVVAKRTAGDDALATMFDLLAYVAELGKALPEGDTVGRSPDERLRVHYVPSPIDATKKVWRVELK